ncbi:MAG TPA: AAA family ATPase [Chitinophagaceae bacterium]|nr:AAA family ATPase [Chitinophagaceae bacterium]
MRKPKNIPARAVLKQLKADLIGKDSYRGITLTYAWLANQFGHFSLGFIPTFVLYRIFTYNHAFHNPARWAVLFITANWLLFETYNFLGPLLLKKRTTSKIFYLPKQHYVFEPAWWNVGYDTLTDLGFFWLGALCAGLLCHFNTSFLWLIILFAVLLVKPTRYWFITKMYLQTAEYPFQFRLSQWDVELIDDSHKKTIQAFVDNENTGKHLLLFGSEGCGKTSLSIGIATEMSIRHKTCVYTTGTKLYSMFCEGRRRRKKNDCLWDWCSASLIVIDDINSGGDVEDTITAGKFLDFVDRHDDNRDILKEANVIWVLGNYQAGHHAVHGWRAMLEDIGVAEENIWEINLVECANAQPAFA